MTSHFEWLKKHYPDKYKTWQLLLNNYLVGAYMFPVSSVSIMGREDVKEFAQFITPFLGSNVLDIGCGPFYPAYLPQVTDTCAVCGIDVIPQHTFDDVSGYDWYERQTGCAENLPYRAGSFDSSIFGTTLDHVIDLDKSISEACRVTTKHVLVWHGVPSSMLTFIIPAKSDRQVDGWWYTIPKGCVDPFHITYLHLDDIIRAFSVNNWIIESQKSIPGSIFTNFVPR